MCKCISQFKIFTPDSFLNLNHNLLSQHFSLGGLLFGGGGLGGGGLLLGLLLGGSGLLGSSSFDFALLVQHIGPRVGHPSNALGLGLDLHQSKSSRQTTRIRKHRGLFAAVRHSAVGPAMQLHSELARATSQTTKNRKKQEKEKKKKKKKKKKEKKSHFTLLLGSGSLLCVLLLGLGSLGSQIASCSLFFGHTKKIVSTQITVKNRSSNDDHSHRNSHSFVTRPLFPFETQMTNTSKRWKKKKKKKKKKKIFLLSTAIS